MKKLTKLSALSLLTLPAFASAHTGHADASGLVSGFMHTVSGMDHLVAMIALGFWLVQSQRRLSLVQPLLVVSAMLIGATAGVAGLGFTGVEWGVAGSVLLLGLAITFRLPVALFTGVSLSLFGAFHGLAHGMEVPAGLSALTFFIGFSVAALLLAAVGMGLASAVSRLRLDRAAVWLGLSISGLGAAFMTLV